NRYHVLTHRYTDLASHRLYCRGWAMQKPGDEPQAPVESVARLLRKRYKDFPHHNPSNALADLLFIVCSRKTNERNYRPSYRALRRGFPTFELLATASADE